MENLKTLLIIEDDFAYSQLLSRRLAKQGFICHIAETATQALLIAREVLPEYVLVDLKLGLDSGLNLITPLRHLLPRSQIVMLTGYASIANAVEAVKQGADNYLAKPADSTTIAATLLACEVRQLPDDCVRAQGSESDVLSTRQLEWQHIQQVLAVNHGNVSATARQLGMHRRTLQRKLQKHSPAPNQASTELSKD